jgi:LacI family purine nucleotide synthesis repressor
MKKLLASERAPTAVFAGNDPMAVGAVCACRDAGIAVPEEMSIIGAGNIEGEHAPSPFLTTIDWPRVELGRNAATLLIAAIANPEQEPREEILPPRLLVRRSTAPPPVPLDRAAVAADRTPLSIEGQRGAAATRPAAMVRGLRKEPQR